MKRKTKNEKFYGIGQIDRSNDSIEHYKSVLNSFNFNYANDIINLIKDENLICNETYAAANSMYYTRLSNQDKFKKQAKTLAFIMNKTYLNSELFQKHWNEAKSMNKEIIFLNEDLYPSQLGEFRVKIFKLCRSESDLEYNYELNEFLLKLQHVRFFLIIILYYHDFLKTTLGDIT